jgi:hypothetical protein
VLPTQPAVAGASSERRLVVPMTIPATRVVAARWPVVVVAVVRWPVVHSPAVAVALWPVVP